jgi:hypothetical protein
MVVARPAPPLSSSLLSLPEALPRFFMGAAASGGFLAPCAQIWCPLGPIWAIGALIGGVVVDDDCGGAVVW